MQYGSVIVDTVRWITPINTVLVVSVDGDLYDAVPTCSAVSYTGDQYDTVLVALAVLLMTT